LTISNELLDSITAEHPPLTIGELLDSYTRQHHTLASSVDQPQPAAGLLDSSTAEHPPLTISNELLDSITSVHPPLTIGELLDSYTGQHHTLASSVDQPQPAAGLLDSSTAEHPPLTIDTELLDSSEAHLKLKAFCPFSYKRGTKDRDLNETIYTKMAR